MTPCCFFAGERYDFVINADQSAGAYWIQVRGLGECGIKRTQQLGILRYARGPYQPSTPAPSYDVGIPQGIVSTFMTISLVRSHFLCIYECFVDNCTNCEYLPHPKIYFNSHFDFAL